MTKPVTRVAVIGAGASGLPQVKQLLDTFARDDVKTSLEVVVYESRNEVGGTWLFHPDKPYVQSEDPDKEQLYFYPPGSQDPSPMYEGLVTNIPIDLMSYRDLPFDISSAPLFPSRAVILGYLQAYAEKFGLRKYIRFNTRVTRLYQAHSSARRWTLEAETTGGEKTVEEFDYVSVSNGHYSDVYIPEIPGLGSFPGEVLHSRFYTRPEDYRGRSILIVGSYASGSDLSRQLACLNIGKYTPTGQPSTPPSDQSPSDQSAISSSSGGYTKIYQSAGTAPNFLSAQPGDPPRPWDTYITNVPIITHLTPPSAEHPQGVIHFEDGRTIDDVDTIIFATGYHFALPFCKVTDAPWRSKPILDGVITPQERQNGRESDIGGIKGLGVQNVDELMLFLDGDRSIAFLVLQYLIVPFPFAEAQSRLISRLWAGLLPSFPEHPALPSNPSNPYSTPPPTPPSHPSTPKPLLGLEGDVAANPKAGKEEIRKAVQFRKKLVFGDPYEWVYVEFLMKLMAEAGETEDHWKSVEEWIRERRADKGLRARTLGW